MAEKREVEAMRLRYRKYIRKESKVRVTRRRRGERPKLRLHCAAAAGLLRHHTELAAFAVNLLITHFFAYLALSYYDYIFPIQSRFCYFVTSKVAVSSRSIDVGRYIA